MNTKLINKTLYFDVFTINGNEIQSNYQRYSISETVSLLVRRKVCPLVKPETKHIPPPLTVDTHSNRQPLP